MAEKITIARPYAEAIFGLAQATDTFQPWSDAMDQLLAIVGDETLRSHLADPNLLREQLYTLITEVGGDTLGEEQRNFVHVLIENGRLQLIPEIRALFLSRKNAYEGIQDTTIVSAFPLTKAALATLRNDLEERFQMKLNIMVRLDPELIGGVRIEIGDEVIDASVRGKLASLATALKN